jgi:hypothetical protein
MFVLFMIQPDSSHKNTKMENGVDCMVRTEFTIVSFSVIVELSPLPLLKYDTLLSLISKLMVTCWMTDGEHSQQSGWGQELPRKRESTSTAKFGSSDCLDP